MSTTTTHFNILSSLDLFLSYFDAQVSGKQAGLPLKPKAIYPEAFIEDIWGQSLAEIILVD